MGSMNICRTCQTAEMEMSHGCKSANTRDGDDDDDDSDLSKEPITIKTAVERVNKNKQ